MSTRRFNEREISSILKRATELQEQQDGAGAHAPHGLTLEEIQQIAHDVGVDPELVAWAVEEMDQPAAQHGFHVWGGPLKIEQRRRVRGHLTDETMDKLINAIRERRGEAGSFEKLGGMMTWQNKAYKADMEIKIAPHEGGAMIKATQKLGLRTFLLYYVPLIITFLIGLPFVANGAFLSAGLGFTLLVALMIAEILAIRAGVSLLSRKDQREMDALMQHLESVLREAAPAQATALKEPAASTRLDVPEDTDAEEEQARRRRSATQ